jgi:hypothetical protein
VQVGELYAAPAHGIAYKPSRLRARTSALLDPLAVDLDAFERP